MTDAPISTTPRGTGLSGLDLVPQSSTNTVYQDIQGIQLVASRFVGSSISLMPGDLREGAIRGFRIIELKCNDLLARLHRENQ